MEGTSLVFADEETEAQIDGIPWLCSLHGTSDHRISLSHLTPELQSTFLKLL
jgi:hypothetical protein